MTVQFEQLGADRQRRIIEVCREYEESRFDATPPSILQFLERLPDEDRTDALLELVAIDVELRLAASEDISVEDYVRQFPDHAESIGSTYREVVSTLPTDAVPLTELRSSTRLGDFVIVREIGRGGMGLVYEAIQESLQRRVALKVLPKHSLLAGTAQQRFEREAKAVARLHHNHIVEVYGTGEQDGVRYFAMRLIDGDGLHVLIEQLRSARPQLSDISRRFASALSDEDSFNRKPQACAPEEHRHDTERSHAHQSVGDVTNGPVDGTNSPRSGERGYGMDAAQTHGNTHTCGLRLNDGERCQFAARVGQQIAEALHYAHGEGVLHRDVKPSNIMLDAQGKAWLTDFGLAKLMQEEAGENLTERGDVVGTLRYMAPETLRGMTDGRSDVYSLGLTLFELLVLRPPFETSNRDELLQQRLTAESPRLDMAMPGLPRDLVTVIQKAIDREPAARYQAAGELADDLRRFLNDEPIHARRVSWWERFWRWARRNKVLAGSLLMTMTVLLISAIVAGLAAAHFKTLETEQRTLATEKGTLAEKNETLAARNANLAGEAQAERDSTTLLVSDVFTQQGLKAADEGRDREALLWFAQSAAKSEPLDDERTRKSLGRYQRLSTQMARPVALLENAGAIERLFIHPSHRYVLMRPHRGDPPAIWDFTTQQPVVLPESVSPAKILAWSPDGEWLAVGGDSQVTLLPFPECIESFNRTPQARASDDDQAAADQVTERARLRLAVKREQAPRVIAAPLGSVLRVEFDASGRFLAMATNHVARVWDLEAEAFVCPPLVHDYVIAGLVISPDHGRLVTFGGERKFDVFELGESGHAPTQNSTAVVSGTHRFEVDPIAAYCTPKFVRQGKGLVAFPTLNLMQVWNLDSSQPEQPFVVDLYGTVFCAELLPNDEIFVGGSNGRTIISVGRPNGLQTKFVPDNLIRDNLTAAYDSVGDRLFAGFSSRDNELWSVRERRPLPCSANVSKSCWNCAFSADGRMLATSNSIGEIVIWEMPNHTESAHASGSSFNRTPQARASPESASQSREDAHACGLRFNENGDFAVCLDDEAHQAAFSADSRYLAVTSFHTNASVYDLQSRQRVATLPTPVRSEFVGILQPFFLSDAEQLAVDVRQSNQLRRLDLWNWRTGEQRPALETPNTISSFSRFMPRFHQTADKRHLLAPGDNGTAFVYDLKPTGEITPQRVNDPEISGWLGFSPDGQVLFGQYGPNRPNIGVLYNVTTTTRTEPLPHQGKLRSMRFSSDMTRLATCSWDNTVKVWDPSTLKLLAGPLPHTSAAYAAEFSSDNRYLLTFAKDATASVWDLSTGQLAAAPFSGQEDIMAAFRPGHDQVIIVDFSGWLHIWDWRTSTRLWPATRLFTPPDLIWTHCRTLTLSPDGRYAAVGGRGALQVIDLTPLDNRDPPPPTSDILLEAELLSGRRVLDNGQLTKLTSDEWLERSQRIQAKSFNRKP